MERILAWLHAKNPELTTPIDADFDLIEARLIDSLQFLEFIYLLEELSGRAIDLAATSVDDFRTLNRINTRFLTPQDAEVGTR